MGQLGRYTLVEPLGEGGMAEVFRARLDGPMGFRKELAIKRIRDSVVRQNEEHVRSLINEARIGGRLKHPNIVEIYELGEDAGAYYIAMELVQGVTLADILRESRERRTVLPVRVALDVGIQVCRALQYAHDWKEDDGSGAPVVHRDLKPSNVMITKEGQAKLMDFGIAKASTNLFDTTETGIAKGTPLYMSPEQLRGLRPLPSSSDLFSLGSILYEMATGRLLFAGRTIPEIITRVLSQPLDEAAREVEERVPGLGTVFSHCVERDVAQRYRSAAEAGAELQQLLEWQDKEPSTAQFVQEFQRGTVLGVPRDDAGADGRVDPEAPTRVADSTARAPRPGEETVVHRWLRARALRRRILGVAGLLLLLGGAAAAVYVYRGTLGVSLQADAGREALNRGDLDAALSLWEEAMRANPGRQEPRFAWASLLALRGRGAVEARGVLKELEFAAEDDASAFVRKYRGFSYVLRSMGDDREAFRNTKLALDKARGAQAAGMPLPPALLWEAGELALLRESTDAARGYFRELAANLPPGQHADGAAAFAEAVDRGDAALLRAELLWIAGRREEAWLLLGPALDRSMADRRTLDDERLVWAYRALAEERYEDGAALLGKVGSVAGDPEARRSLAAARAAAEAGMGRADNARRELAAALKAGRTREAAGAARLLVATALLRSSADKDWASSLVDEAALDLGDSDPDLRKIADARTRGTALPPAPPGPFLALDPRSGRFFDGGMARGGPGATRLVPAEAFPAENVSRGGLAWPFGPAFHPVDGEPMQVFYRPGG
jgi:tRNA A-37 threonylcarbamoyl transferase component Bud32